MTDADAHALTTNLLRERYPVAYLQQFVEDMKRHVRRLALALRKFARYFARAMRAITWRAQGRRIMANLHTATRRHARRAVRA